MRLAILLVIISFNVFAQDNQKLRFVENKGQWAEEIDFSATVPGGRLGVSSDGFSVLLLDMEELEHRHLASHDEINESTGVASAEPVDGHYFQIKLLGANPNSKAKTTNPLEGRHNYFSGNDALRWVVDARAFSSITYPEVYEGIDFRVSSSGKNLKYDFIVRPGGDPSQIKLSYNGVNLLEKTDGDLKIHTSIGILNELKPVSYQIGNVEHKSVASQFRLLENVVTFEFPEGYDRSRELVIDPLLIFSTFSGSTADNWGSTATPGEKGSLYSAGVTRQDLGGFFPATVGAFQTSNHGNFDMAVIKYDSSGSRFLYATHLGGINNDSPVSLVMDNNTGDLLVLGISSSPDYPTGESSFDRTFNNGSRIDNQVLNTTDEWDIVVTRLSRDGNILVGSTFLGGTGNDGLNFPKRLGGALVANYGDEMRGDIITDDAGNVFISSVTSSVDFPVQNGFDTSFNGGITDGIVVKLTPDLSSIIWSTFIGGSGFDAAYSIKFDPQENIMLGGGTSSTNFPVTTNAYQTLHKGIVDGWIARVSADGSTVVNSTLTGTNSFDQIYFIDLNSNGNVFCYGQTAGRMPVTTGVFHNNNTGQFLQKFSPDLSTLEISTIFGSPSPSGLIIPNISPTAFLVNDCDNIYMAGWGGRINSNPSMGFWQNNTMGMPITSDAYQKTSSGSDFYFIVLNGDATKLVYSTYLGGNSSKTHVDGGTSRFDKYGIVYHSVCSGCTFENPAGPSSDFPTTGNAKSTRNLSLNCNNAAFKFDLSSLRAHFDTNNLKLTQPGFNNVCFPDSIVFQNLSTGGKTITWEFGDGRVLIQDDTDSKNIIHHYKQPGQYLVKLKIEDLSTCSQKDSTTKVIHYFKDNIKVVDDGPVCEGSAFQLTASGGTIYQWTSKDGTFTSAEQSPRVIPGQPSIYFVTVTDKNGCSRKDTVNVSVIPYVRAFFETYLPDFSKSGINTACFPEGIRFKNKSLNGESFTWDFADGTVVHQLKSDTTSILHAFGQPGAFHVKLKATNPNTCNKADSVVKIIQYFKDNIKAGPDEEICEGTTTRLNVSGGIIYFWSTDDNSFSSSSQFPFVQPSQTTSYYVTVQDANGCIRKDTMNVSVIHKVNLEWEHFYKASCTDLPSVQLKNLTPADDDVTFLFDFGDGVTSAERDVEHFYEKDGVYSVKFMAQKKICSYMDVKQVPVFRLLIPNVITPDGSTGLNDHFEIRLGEDFLTSDAGVKIQLNVFDRWGKKVFESKDYRNDWNGADLVSGVYFIHLKVGDFTTCKNWLHVLK